MVYLEDADFTLYCGDALETLRELPDRSVHMCVTSPPFYGLRDYGTGSWEGGDEGCDHRSPVRQASQSSRLRMDGRAHLGPYEGEKATQAETSPYRDVCGKCGARRVDRQIGLETTPDEWVARLVEVFREVRRVLRDDGTLWCEVGDSYATGTGRNDTDERNLARRAEKFGTGRGEGTGPRSFAPMRHPTKPKDLIGAPWLLAFALRADGWYLRSDIVWARPNPMPESVRDRPTKSHSYVFLLSKGPRYFFDAEAVREPHVEPWRSGTKETSTSRLSAEDDGVRKFGVNGRDYNPAGRNVRSVWTIPTEPLPDEHYAAFPQKLVERCILAGTSERGVCPECGAPWERIAERAEQPQAYAPVKYASEDGGIDAAHRTKRNMGGRYQAQLDSNPIVTTGWQPTCECHGWVYRWTEWDDRDMPLVRSVYVFPGNDEAEQAARLLPAIVLDPFMGSGTTALVARRLGRRCVGVELSADYCAIAARRTQQLGLFADDGDHVPAVPAGDATPVLPGKNERHIDHRKHGFNQRWKQRQSESPNKEKEQSEAHSHSQESLEC